MEELKKIDQLALIDMLSKYTKEYMHMFKEGSMGDEYAKCKKIIEKITKEIESRKQEKSNVKKRSGTEF